MGSDSDCNVVLDMTVLDIMVISQGAPTRAWLQMAADPVSSLIVFLKIETAD
jgi:hypothetical protein